MFNVTRETFRRRILSRPSGSVVEKTGVPVFQHDLSQHYDQIEQDVNRATGRWSTLYPMFLAKDARAFRIRPASPAPQARLTSGVQVVSDSLLSGTTVCRSLDFLKVSFWLKWDATGEGFFHILDQLKKTVQDTSFQMTIPAFKERNFDFNLSRTGTAKYSYRLTSGDVVLMFNRRQPKDKFPNCRFEVGSLSCWSPGWYQIYRNVVGFLSAYGAEVVQEKVSECHLAADFVGFDIRDPDNDIKSEEKWITRASLSDPKYGKADEDDDSSFGQHYVHRKFTGANMGQGNLMLRVYDKVNELKNKRAVNKQEVFSEVWHVNQFDEKPVTRVEFQIRRPVLRLFKDPATNQKINTVKELFNSLSSLWRYLTVHWCRHSAVPVSRNHNQRKAPTSVFWTAVQAVVWSGVFGLIRMQPTKHRDIELLRKMARGCLMSVCASMEIEPDDIDRIVYFCKDLIEEDLHKFFEDEKAFVDAMLTRRNEFRSTLAG